MPRIIYVNIIWLSIVTSALIIDAIARYASALWSSLPDAVQNASIISIGMLVCMFIAATIGIIKKKKWGYDFTVSLNYVLGILSFIPIAGFAIYCLKTGFPVSEIPLEYVTPNILGAIVSVVSLIFALLIRRKSVSSVFENM